MKTQPQKTARFSAMFFMSGLLALSLVGCTTKNSSESANGNGKTALSKIEGQRTAQLATAPNVPKPLSQYKTNQKVIVNMFSQEKVMKLASTMDSEVDYTYWTFNGTTPGPIIRVRQGDEVEVHLSNDPSSKMPHNVDFHACTGPGGGAESSLTLPGHTSTFSFRALEPGLFMYHCAAPPVGMHIANGMYGMIIVEPKNGFKPVDKEFAIVQSEFYTTGKHGQPGLQKFDLQKALDEDPDYVVFDGSVGALTGSHALHAKVGDKIRMFVGNAGPNLVSSFHIIGVILDNVYVDGGTLVNHDVQTTLIPAGGAAIVEFTCKVPGTYTIVDHSIFRAFNKGAIGQLIVTGKKDTAIYSGKLSDKLYQPAK